MEDISAQTEEQGQETGSKELDTEADADAVGQLPVPFGNPTISAVQAEVGGSSCDVQRKSKGVGPTMLELSGLSLTPQPFMGKSPASDLAYSSDETPNGRSLPPSRSTSTSSEEALEPGDVTPEHVRALKKDAKKSKRLYEQEIKEWQDKNLKLEKRIRELDLAHSSQPSTLVQAEQDIQPHTQGLKKHLLLQTLSYPIQPEQTDLNSTVVVYQPQSPTRCDSVPYLRTQSQEQQQLIEPLKLEVKQLKKLLVEAKQQLQFERVTQQNLKSLHEREREIYQNSIIERDIKIEHLERSNAWLEEKLEEKEAEIEVLVHEDEFDKIYRFVEAKSNTLVEGDRCIICDSVPGKSDKCLRTKPDKQPCDRPAKEHLQTRLRHKFKGHRKEDKCTDKQEAGQLCGRPIVEHQDLGHSFKAVGLCQSHLYPGCVLAIACKGEKNSWIYDGIDHTSRTPNDCKRRLICDLCEPKTSKLEDGLKDRMKSCSHKIDSDDQVLFSVLAYRSMVFSLYHYRKECCNRYRTDIKSIMQYGWRCHYDLRYTSKCDIKPPALLHLQSLHDELPATLHLPAVCELDFTATRPPPPPELGNTVVALYGCIPPYHYVLLRDSRTADILQQLYCREIILSINKRLSEEVEAYYEENKKAKDWLEGQRKHPELGQHWWPILTFGHLKCCLKIRVE